jgi:hypothetical protein
MEALAIEHEKKGEIVKAADKNNRILQVKLLQALNPAWEHIIGEGTEISKE